MHEPPSVHQRILFRRRPPRSVARRPGFDWPAADGCCDHASRPRHRSSSHLRRHCTGQMSAGAQAISPLSDLASEHPLVLLPLEDGVAPEDSRRTSDRRRRASAAVATQRRLERRIPARHARGGALGDVRSAAQPPRQCTQGIADVQIVGPGGFGDVFARMMEQAARNLETLSDAEWLAIAQSLADLLPTFTRQLAEPTADLNSGTATKAATLHRLCQTIERRLDDADLTPAKVALAEGISERYLQKLFEGTGSSFTHYLRERRLQRTWADLSNPSEAHHSISEIAFRAGFNDSAHFSRTFRHRFGLSPREFRQNEAERLTASATAAGQRGWPQEALAQLRSQHAPSTAGQDCAAGAGRARCARHRDASKNPAASSSRRRCIARALGLFQPLAAAADRDRIPATRSPSKH
jgi:AraC-like DNA-binding protein